MTGEGAPVLPALLVRGRRDTFLAVWCRFCKDIHVHGRTEGHRAAHCFPGVDSPYTKTGYVLRQVGETTLARLRLWERYQLRKVKRAS